MNHTTKPPTTYVASWCWLIVSAIVIAIVAFGHFPDEADWKWCIPLEGRFHLPMMAAGLATVLLIGWLCIRYGQSEMVSRSRLLLITGALTLVHIVLTYSYYLYTDWDVQQLTGLAEAMATGAPIDEYYSYFRWAPNNLLLTRIFALVFFVTGPLWGLHVSLFPLLILQCIGAGITALMLFQIAMHIWNNKRYAVMSYLFYTLLVWLSPWWSIPYSDIWGLMLSVVLLWLATTLPFRRQWLRIGIVGAVTALGYYIKPQTVLVSLSIVLIELLVTIRSRRNIKSLLKPTGFALGGLAAGILMAHLAVMGSGLHLHTPKGLGAPHYLMMGANYQSIGIYSAVDVEFSRQYPDKRERHRAELAVTKQRYAALGLKGTMTLWGRKNLLNFSDGTFYWGREGAFYKYVPERKGPIARATRSIYYNRSYNGRWNKTWSTVATSLWFGMLLLSFFAAWPTRKRQKTDNPQQSDIDDTQLTDCKEGQPFINDGQRTLQIILLAVTLLALFHTLFEARARYLFCFTPLFVLLAVEGARRVVGFLRSRPAKERA